MRLALIRFRDERHGGVNARAGRALGMTGSAVSYIVARTNRASYETALKVAKALQVPPGELLDYSPPADVTVDTDPRYPSRARALAAGRLAGIRADALEAVAGMRFKGREGRDIDPGVEYWLSEILHVSRQMEAEDKG